MIHRRMRRAAVTFALFTIFCMTAEAQQGARQRPAAPATSAPATGSAAETARPTLAPLPADKTTSHTIRIGGREIAFNATAGSISLFDERSGAVTARLGYIAFVRTDAGESRKRPVVFAWNGGPGYASAWLNLGAMGPWRLEMAGEAARPSAPPATQPNAETWLEFADLVFLDPAGAGFGRVAGSEEARKFFWSVDGDVASLATAVRRWLVNNDRMASPKFLAGESYGGFRAPKIARRLQIEEGIGVDGLVLVSPVLDFARFRAGGILAHVARLPSYAAAAREKSGSVSRAALADVESYAQGEYLADLMKGLGDAPALARIADNLVRFTGLDRRIVERLGGRVPAAVFAREIHRGERRIASIYDGSETGADPNPFSTSNEGADQLLAGLHAPIVSAMVDLYRNRLEWLPPDERYMFRNNAAGRQWDWGGRLHEATSDLAAALALDSRMRVLIAHGLTDLVTPYFETKMVLDQTPPIAGAGRLRFRVYAGGHMFYAREPSRRAFRDDARALALGDQDRP